MFESAKKELIRLVASEMPVHDVRRITQKHFGFLHLISDELNAGVEGGRGACDAPYGAE